MEVASFRLLSMLNMDYKILCKILEGRIYPHPQQLVYSDQNGFMPKCNMSLNIRKLFRILE
mgnify:CR=1 FL=1